MALWAYRTSKRMRTQMMHFSFVYGVQSSLLVEIAISLACIALRSRVIPNPLPMELEALDKKETKAEMNLKVCQRGIA
ncbi:hypothetical protein ACSBR1_013988 [Camellia fascicularis]